MARKLVLSTEKLNELGTKKLAKIILVEAEQNAGFRRNAKAALAGTSGPEAIAKVIGRQISGLERAKSFIEWDKARAFRSDLRGLIDMIGAELGPVAPALAIDWLLRFIATHERVFERVDDSSGYVQDIYYRAIHMAGDLSQALSRSEADLLPERIMASLGESEHGYLIDLTTVVTPHLPQDTLNRWDNDLKKAIIDRKAQEKKRSSENRLGSMTSQWGEMRQTIAIARGDLDLLIDLEGKKLPYMQDTFGIATQLLDAGRANEALDWVRKPGRRTSDEAYGDSKFSPARVTLEARILDALDDKPGAQVLRWHGFETLLSADILREYLKHLPDFEVIEAEERAHEFALEKAEPETALLFFLNWPRLDLAAKLIKAHPHRWDGRDWQILPKVAKLLEHEHPLAATILYRVLLDDILDRARSKAYSHGIKYLKKLTLLSAEADPTHGGGIIDHETYLAHLKKNHPRKTGFWTRLTESG